MVNKGNTLGKLRRSREAVGAYDQVVGTYGGEESPALVAQVALALSYKAATLVQTGQLPAVLATFDEIVRRFQNSAIVKVSVVVEAMVNKGVVLYQLRRLPEALDIFSTVVAKYAGLDSADVDPHLAKSMLNQGTILSLLNRVPEAFRVFDELVTRFADSDAPDVLVLVARSLLNKSVTLVDQGNYRESKETCEEAVRRFGTSTDACIEPLVAAALVSKGVALTGMEEWMESLRVYDEVVDRFANSEVPSTLEQVTGAIINKGAVLQKLERWEEALIIFDEVLSHGSNILTRATLGQVASQSRERLEKLGIAAANKGVILLRFLKSERSYHELIERYGSVRACERDLSVALVVISESGDVSAALVREVLVCCARIGAERALEVIGERGVQEVLLPLVVALQWELGRNQRVAQEVNEVARDIERNLAELRLRWSATSQMPKN